MKSVVLMGATGDGHQEDTRSLLALPYTPVDPDDSIAVGLQRPLRSRVVTPTPTARLQLRDRRRRQPSRRELHVGDVRPDQPYAAATAASRASCASARPCGRAV